jgi:probable HAF family extracellular repeat protein
LTTGDAETHAFLYSGGRLVDLGTLGGGLSAGAAINCAGEITGWSRAAGTPEHAILYSHGVMTDLGTLGGGHSVGVAINDAGQIAGRATLAGDGIFHAFLYGGGVLHDLGTLGGPDSDAWAMNAKGHVTGWAHTGNAVHAYVYKGGAMQDLNALIPPGSGWELQIGSAINDKGQIAGFGVLNGAPRAFLLTPTQSYAAAVLPPINADGSSVFRASRGVVPVKFALDTDAVPTCALPPATIAVTRVAGSAIGVVDQTEYLSSADSGSSFRIADCQYVYNLAASALGTGGYRIDIIIDDDVAGHAVFTLR